MAGWTNRGKYDTLGVMFRAQTAPAEYLITLFTDAASPSADTNVPDDLTEIADGNGYSASGYALTSGSTDFDTWTEDDSNDRALVQIKDVAWTASSGPIPASGSGAAWGAVTTASGAGREIYQYFSLGAVRSVSDGQTLTLQDIEIRITES